MVGGSTCWSLRSNFLGYRLFWIVHWTNWIFRKFKQNEKYWLKIRYPPEAKVHYSKRKDIIKYSKLPQNQCREKWAGSIWYRRVIVEITLVFWQFWTALQDQMWPQNSFWLFLAVTWWAFSTNENNHGGSLMLIDTTTYALPACTDSIL